MFYIVQFMVTWILFYACLILSEIPQEYHGRIVVIMVICKIVGMIEGIIYENLE